MIAEVLLLEVMALLLVRSLGVAHAHTGFGAAGGRPLGPAASEVMDSTVDRILDGLSNKQEHTETEAAALVVARIQWRQSGRG